jgi:hypothetical protein
VQYIFRGQQRQVEKDLLDLFRSDAVLLVLAEVAVVPVESDLFVQVR